MYIPTEPHHGLMESRLHSFKGWESPHVVVLIETARGTEEFRGIYVALSRLRRHAGGSMLLVVSAAPELAEYGSKWPSAHSDDNEMTGRGGR